MRTRRTRHIVLAGVTTAAVAAAGLSAVAVAATTRSLKNGTGELTYSAKRLTATPGQVTITYRNTGNIPHNIAVRGAKLRRPVVGKVVPKGGTSRVRTRLRAGTYTFYCSVPGHAQAGMKGTLVVR